MKIAGFWAGHDTNACILENGKPILHLELERFSRIKEDKGDPIELITSKYGPLDDIDCFATCEPSNILTSLSSYSLLKKSPLVCGHHEAHAANVFYSSNLSDATIITLDGGGIDTDNDGHLITTACTVYEGNDNKITRKFIYDANHVNVGGLWSRVCRSVFRLNNGYPKGSQVGTIMSMAAFGDPNKYKEDFAKMLRSDLVKASMKPWGQPKGAYDREKEPRHPYLGKYLDIADRSEQDAFDLASGLQAATEEYLKEFIGYILSQTKSKNLCIGGGVALNSVTTGKIQEWFPQVKEVFIGNCPYDGGLALGAAQWVYHQVLDLPRVRWEKNFSPYIGVQYSEKDVEEAIKNDKLSIMRNVDDDYVLHEVSKDKIVSVYNGCCEVGKRALGARSIVADPRKAYMKDFINEKVKHRVWHRPYAPSVLAEEVNNWFENPYNCVSSYMNFVLKFKPEVREKVPAVVHVDGSARLQAVCEKDNKWWYNFIKQWHKRTGVPILLNTSFNDTEPIVEHPLDAVKCFMKTEIDYLYFPEYKILVKKK
jgi:carbamoyltransferase